MKLEELEGLSTNELLDIVNDMHLAYPSNYDREVLVNILKTVPEDDSIRRYVEEAEIGMLVAFRIDNTKVKSAKIVKKSTSDKKFLLETKYGAKFLVDFNDVIWVNTTGRWPRWVFKLMKGLDD